MSQKDDDYKPPDPEDDDYESDDDNNDIPPPLIRRGSPEDSESDSDDDDEDEGSGEDDALPFLQKTPATAWDTGKFHRGTDPQGKPFWKCGFCHDSYKHWNHAKVISHAIGGPNIKLCPKIGRKWKCVFQAVSAAATKKKEKKSREVAAFEAHIEDLENAAGRLLKEKTVSGRRAAAAAAIDLTDDNVFEGKSPKPKSSPSVTVVSADKKSPSSVSSSTGGKRKSPPLSRLTLMSVGSLPPRLSLN